MKKFVVILIVVWFGIFTLLILLFCMFSSKLVLMKVQLSNTVLINLLVDVLITSLPARVAASKRYPIIIPPNLNYTLETDCGSISSEGSSSFLNTTNTVVGTCNLTVDNNTIWEFTQVLSTNLIFYNGFEPDIFSFNLTVGVAIPNYTLPSRLMTFVYAC